MLSVFDSFLVPHAHPGYCSIRHRPFPTVSLSIPNVDLIEEELNKVLKGLEGYKDDADLFTFNCNVAGYRPEELKVELENDELVIRGEHKAEAPDQSVHRTFSRRVKLPDGIQKESIKCNLNDHGNLLQIEAKFPAKEQPKRVNIPIGLKSPVVDQQDKQSQVEGQQQQTTKEIEVEKN